MDTVTYTLKEPVTYKDKQITSLTLRKLKMRDLAAMDGVTGETRRALAMVASMADVAIPMLEELGPADFAAMMEAAAPLMGNLPGAAEGQESPPVIQ